MAAKAILYLDEYSLTYYLLLFLYPTAAEYGFYYIYEVSGY